MVEQAPRRRNGSCTGTAKSGSSAGTAHGRLPAGRGNKHEVDRVEPSPTRVGAFDTPRSKSLREALFEAPQVAEALEAWWRTTDLDSNGVVDRDECMLCNSNVFRTLTTAHLTNDLLETLESRYIELGKAFYRVMINDGDEEAAQKSAERDWVADSKGQVVLNGTEFKHAIFELADLWTDVIDADEYARFLLDLLEKMKAVGFGSGPLSARPSRRSTPSAAEQAAAAHGFSSTSMSEVDEQDEFGEAALAHPSQRSSSAGLASTPEEISTWGEDGVGQLGGEAVVGTGAEGEAKSTSATDGATDAMPGGIAVTRPPWLPPVVSRAPNTNLLQAEGASSLVPPLNPSYRGRSRGLSETSANGNISMVPRGSHRLAGLKTEMFPVAVEDFSQVDFCNPVAVRRAAAGRRGGALTARASTSEGAKEEVAPRMLVSARRHKEHLHKEHLHKENNFTNLVKTSALTTGVAPQTYRNWSSWRPPQRLSGVNIGRIHF